MRRNFLSSFGLLVLATAAAAGAAQAQAKPAKTTSLSADLGFVNAAGNSSVTSFNVGDKFVAQTQDKRLVFTQTFAVVYGRTDGDKSAENYRAHLRLEHHLTDGLFVFGLTGWERNVFAGIGRRLEETVGLSWKPVALPRDELGFEGGLSLFQQHNTVAEPPGTFDNNYKAGRIGANYKHTFSKSAFASQSVDFLPNFDDATDWRLNTESSLVAPISTAIGLKLAYVIRYDNLPSLKPAPNPTLERFAKTDRFFTAGISISY
jgi:putative salt-induced outer membrane protein